MASQNLVVVSLLATAAASGQIPSVQGPVSGFLYDAASRSIRPVVGFLGSSYLGKAVLDDVTLASIAPDGEAALVGQGGRYFLAQALRSEAPRQTPIADLIEGIDHVAWARNARAALVYSSASRRLQRVVVLASGVDVRPATDLSYPEGDVTCLVTNEDATQIAIAIRHPAHGGLYTLPDGASAVRLVSLADPGACVFGSADVLYAIDRRTREVLRVESLAAGGWEPLRFAGEGEPLADPVGIALGRNDQRLYVAGGLDRALREYDLSSRTLLSEHRLDAAPQYLKPLAGNPLVFVLGPRERPGQPTWVLDSRLAPSVLFVPAGGYQE